MAWPAEPITPELGDLTDDVRILFEELEKRPGRRGVAGQCTPALDVIETDETVELIVDLPGVPADALMVLLKGNVVVIAGEKAPMPGQRETGPGDFHLVERGFGRFARAIRVVTAFDGGRATAMLDRGELRIALPKIHERRGRAQPMTIAGVVNSKR
jgi:HSP20 family protein